MADYFSPSRPQSSDPTERPLKTLVLGYGYSAKIFHIPFIIRTPGLVLHSIAQRPTADNSATDAAIDYPSLTIFRSWEQVKKYQAAAAPENKIDLLVVTVCNKDHAKCARNGLLLGMHIVVEKPFSVASAEADELIELAKRQNRVLSVYHNRRLDSDYLTLKGILSQDSPTSIREVTYICSTYNRWVPNALPTKAWKQPCTLGNGILYDLGSHLIDQVLDLVNHDLTVSPTFNRSSAYGGMILPSRVMALLHDERGVFIPQSMDRAGWGSTWVDDGFDVFLYFDMLVPRLICHLSASSMSARLPHERWRVRGKNGKEWYKVGRDQQEDQMRYEMCAPDTPGFGEEPETHVGVTYKFVVGGLEGSKRQDRGVLEEKSQNEHGKYHLYYSNIVAAVAGREELLVKPEEGAAVLRVIEAAAQSWREGRLLEVPDFEKERAELKLAEGIEGVELTETEEE
ncbi:hypothetical protein DFH27DRAFT_546497 [Peziza echinospora]|nr:hypothetical protein DFH27DRAFT_546497 [Peziza echinospora]